MAHFIAAGVETVVLVAAARPGLILHAGLTVR